MDRRQWVAQRTHEFLEGRLEEVTQKVRQDRQEMRGWQEPAHLRAVVRRAVSATSANTSDTVEVAVEEMEFCRSAAEPDRGQQREAIGQLLEAGAAGLEKVARHQASDLSTEELLGLECVLLMYGRPAVLVSEGRMASVPSCWDLLEHHREDVEMIQRGVGRIELLGHPEYDWAGTGFLVNENCLLTTRRTAELFTERQGERWQFRPGISAWMDYRSHYQSVATAGYRVRSIIGVHDRYDLAVLEVESPQNTPACPMPLAMAAEAPSCLEGRPVYMVGYPVHDARRSEPESISRIFRDVYNVKRVMPGMLRGCQQFHEIHLLHHDCCSLGQTTGACIVDLETHRVLGLQLSGRYLETSTAIPLWVLREDPLLRRAGVTFVESTPVDLERTTSQLERLARSRYWNEVRTLVESMYQRAFHANGANGTPGHAG